MVLLVLFHLYIFALTIKIIVTTTTTTHRHRTTPEEFKEQLPQYVRTVKAAKAELTAVDYHHGTNRIVTASQEEELKIWDGTTAEQIGRLKRRGHEEGNIKLHITLLFLSIYLSTHLSLYYHPSHPSTLTHTHVCLYFSLSPPPTPPQGVNDIVFSYDGNKLASGSDDYSIMVWDVNTRRRAHKLVDDDMDQIRSLSFNRSGNLLVSTSVDNNIRLWDVESGELIKTLASNTDDLVEDDDDEDENDSGEGSSARPSASSAKATSGDNEGSNLYDVRFSPNPSHKDNLIAVASDDSTVQMWSLSKEIKVDALEGHTDEVTCLCFNSTGDKLVSGSADSTAIVWSLVKVVGRAKYKFAETVVLNGHSGELTSIAFSHDDQRLVTGSEDFSVRVWDGQTSRELFTLKGHTDFVQSVRFLQDINHVVSVADDKTMKVWDLSVESSTGKFEGDHIKHDVR